MKVKIALSFIIGMLLLVNGFDKLWVLFFSSESVDALRGPGSYSFLHELFRLSRLLYFISFLGFVGLVIASIIALQVCIRLKISKHIVTVSFLVVYVINAPIVNDLLVVPYKNAAFEKLSVRTIFLLYFVASFLAGFIFLVFPLYFKYFKYAYKGGGKTQNNES